MQSDELKFESKNISIEEFTHYREFLSRIYERVKNSPNKYSYRKFSNDLGFGETNISWLIVSGKRKLTTKTAAKVIHNLDIKGPQAKYFKYLVSYEESKNETDREKYFKLLLRTKLKIIQDKQKKADLQYLENCFNPIIREICALQIIDTTPEALNINTYLNLPLNQFQKSLDLLRQMKLIKFSKKLGRYLKTAKDVFPDEDIAKIGSLNYHREMLDLGKTMLATVPPDQREYNSVTVSLPTKDIGKVKHILRKACEDIMKLEKKSSEPDQVLTINTQMFPYIKYPNEGIH